MRISDWSSEVCSSDLIAHNFPFVFPPNAQTRQPRAIQEYIVANIKSSKKRAKQAVVRNLRNNSQRSMLRTSVKKVLKALEANDAVGAQEAFKSAQPLLDRFSPRGLIHKNKAARHKTRLTARIKTRSEEHTTELQQLIRNPHAVFCM